MHLEAWTFLWEQADKLDPRPGRVVELGGRNVNGSARDLFPEASYLAVDIAPGRGVDVVADCADWEPTGQFDLVVCTEVLEHTPRWREILATAAKCGGTLLVTAACDPRAPHSGIDGGPVRDGEWYANVDPGDLRTALEGLYERVEIATHPRGDVYGVAS